MKSNKWIFNVRREATVFAGAGMTYAFGISKKIGIPFQYQNVRYANFEWWFSADEFNKLKNILSELFQQDRKVYDRIIQNQYVSGEKLKSSVQTLNEKQFTDQQLKNAYGKYVEKLLEFYSFYVFPTVAGEIVEEEVKKILKKKHINFEFSDLVYPNKILNSNKARIELLKIGRDPIFKKVETFEELDNKTKKTLARHASLFGWESYSFHIGTALTPQDYFKKIKEEKNCSDGLIRYSDQEKERKANEKILKSSLTPKEFETIKLLQKIIYFRNYQKETMNECQFKSIPFLTKVADQICIKFSQLQMMTPLEIGSALAGKKINIKEIEKRQSGYKVELKSGNLEISADKTKTKRSRQIKQFSGQVACKGHVDGIARIILNKEELSKFEKGEILVASMTSVDYISALRKAKAIITDEGSVTCHAAIFSREFNIPCITSTKIATKVLKNGDYVEVDANTGLVKILN